MSGLRPRVRRSVAYARRIENSVVVMGGAARPEALATEPGKVYCRGRIDCGLLPVGMSSGWRRAPKRWRLRVALCQFHRKVHEFQCLETFDILAKISQLSLDIDCPSCYYSKADLEVHPKWGRPRKMFEADNGCLWHCRSALADAEYSHRHFESVAVSPTAHLYN